MDQTAMLAALKIDLGLTADAYDTRLTQLLADAAARIKREGAAIDAASSPEDANLVIMYAAWLWRRRDGMDGMPRMLRWALNNRVFCGKMQTEEGT